MCAYTYLPGYDVTRGRTTNAPLFRNPPALLLPSLWCNLHADPTPARLQLTFLFPSSSSSSDSSSAAAHTFTRASAWQRRVTCIEVMITRGPRVVPPSQSSRQRPTVGLGPTAFISFVRARAKTVYANDINLPSKRDVLLSNVIATLYPPMGFWGHGHLPQKIA